MSFSDGVVAPRGATRRAGLLATACLVGLAPVKFSVPAVLHQLDTWPRGIDEWVYMGWPTAVFLGLLAACLALAAWELRGGGVPFRPMLPALAFLAVQGLSSAFTVNGALSGAVMVLFASLVAGYALGCALGRDDEGLRALLVGWVVGACLVAWSGIAQATGGLEETRKFLEAHPEMGAGVPELWDRVSRGRVFATFVYPNALGGYVATSVFLVAAWVASKRQTPRGTLLLVLGILLAASLLSCAFSTDEFGGYAVATVLLMVMWLAYTRRGLCWPLLLALGVLLAGCLLFCLWKSQSKGGYAALFGAALLFAAGGGLRRRLAIGLAAALLLAGVAGFAAGYGRKGVEKGRRTFAARVDYWRAAWRIGLDHPVLGSGPGTFAKLYPRYKSWDAESTRLVHNNYLQMWCDSGILGFAAFVALLPGTLFAWWRRSPGAPVENRWPRTLTWAGLVAFAIHSLVDFDLYLAGNAWPAFVLLGALAAATDGKEQREA